MEKSAVHIEKLKHEHTYIAPNSLRQDTYTRQRTYRCKGKGKGKAHPITGHEGPYGE